MLFYLYVKRLFLGFITLLIFGLLPYYIRLFFGLYVMRESNF